MRLAAAHTSQSQGSNIGGGDDESGTVRNSSSNLHAPKPFTISDFYNSRAHADKHREEVRRRHKGKINIVACCDFIMHIMVLILTLTLITGQNELISDYSMSNWVQDTFLSESTFVHASNEQPVGQQLLDERLLEVGLRLRHLRVIAHL